MEWDAQRKISFDNCQSYNMVILELNSRPRPHRDSAHDNGFSNSEALLECQNIPEPPIVPHKIVAKHTKLTEEKLSLLEMVTHTEQQ